MHNCRKHLIKRQAYCFCLNLFVNRGEVLHAVPFECGAEVDRAGKETKLKIYWWNMKSNLCEGISDTGEQKSNL